MKTPRIGRVLSVAAILTMYATSAQAQFVSAERAVYCFEAQHSDSIEDCEPSAVGAKGVLVRAEEYGAEVVGSVQDGLEALAKRSDDPYVRSQAIGWLALPGSEFSGFRMPGTVRRLESVYDARDDYASRLAVVRLMALQEEQVEASAFLERVARGPTDDATPRSLLRESVKRLARMGPVGAASLDRLRSDGLVK